MAKAKRPTRPTRRRSGSRQSISSRSPLELTERTEPFFAQMISLLNGRSKKHAVIAYSCLAAMGVSIILAVLLIAFARTILGQDLEKARWSAALLTDLNSQKEEIATEEKHLIRRTDSLKADFLANFGSGQAWLSAILPRDFTSRLSWADLRGSYGFAVGNQILFTQDSGWNWSPATVSNADPNDPFEAADAGFALGGYQDSLLGWAVGKRGKIARSSDGGRTWKATTAIDIDRITATSTFNYIFFRDPTNGWAIGDDGLIATTNDGGGSWNVRQQNTTMSSLYYARFYTDDVSIAIGSDMTILLSDDGGWNWRNESPKIASLAPAPTGKFNFLAMDSSNDRVIVVGTNGIILTGERQGKSFQWRFADLVDRTSGTKSPLTGNVQAIGTLRWIDHFGGTQNVLAVGDKGTALISNDFGRSWRSLQLGQDRSFTFVQAISAERALIAGENNFIGQIELQGSSSIPSVVPDSTPAVTTNIRWISPPEQISQVAIGTGVIMHRVKFSEALVPLRASGGEDFIRIAADPLLQRAALQSVPENTILRATLGNILHEASQIKERLESLHEKSIRIADRREQNLSNPAINSQEFLWWLNGSRALVVVIAFFVIRFLSALYRYHSGLATYYQARGDALRMLRVIPGTITELAAVFAPKPLDEVTSGGVVDELLKTAKGILGTQPKS
jgi:photosystem II stability/assembly factor-like uncharacterized protein